MGCAQGGLTPSFMWPWMRRVCWSGCLLHKDHGGLRTGFEIERRHRRRSSDRRQGLRYRRNPRTGHRARHERRLIPPKKNRTVQSPYDENLYKLRHLVENAFFYLKHIVQHRHPLRQKRCFLPHRRPNSVPRSLAQNLVTTLSSPVAIAP